MPFRPQEYLYLHMLAKWEKTAPPDRHKETLDGRPASNTQGARMARLLTVVVAGHTADSIDATLQKLERRNERKNGASDISKDKSWMREPCEITRGWYFEGCMSLRDKQAIIKDLPSVGLISPAFVPCAQDFVAAKPLLKYWPGSEESHRLIQLWRDANPQIDAIMNNENVREQVLRLVFP